MHRPSLPPRQILYCVILYCLAGPGMAQSPIYRCIGAHGDAVFSDQPCAAMQATPISAPPSMAASTATTTASSPLPILCAANLGKLRQGIIEAFARHDANRLAGLFLWDGYSQDAVIAHIRSLGKLTEESLLDISTPSSTSTQLGPPPAQSSGTIALAPFASGSTPAPTPDAHQLVLRTDGDNGLQEQRFDLVHRAGCVWLHIAD